MNRIAVRITSLVAVLVFIFVQFAHGQLKEIKNEIKKNVPLEIEFKNHDTKEWVRDLEIKVRNTGQKPIHYLWLILYLDTKDPKGNFKAYSFKFGRSSLYSTEAVAKDGDPAIFPGESHIFKVETSSVKAWNILKTREDYDHARKGALSLGFLNFGDGTGIGGGSKPFKKKNFREPN